MGPWGQNRAGLAAGCKTIGPWDQKTMGPPTFSGKTMGPWYHGFHGNHGTIFSLVSGLPYDPDGTGGLIDDKLA